jgi:uncharacterized protein (DUF1800 family)
MDSNTQHLYNRALFGTRPEDDPATGKKPSDILGKADETKMIRIVGMPETKPRVEKAMMTEEARKERQQRLKNEQLLLNITWFGQLTDPQTAWREKMTLFWHDHFACRTRLSYLAQQQNNTIRQHALGTFGDLLRAVSKDAAMLQFLNNQQNRKGHPNENFAREVMELFTLGRGNYSEDDIKNAARAFTGWTFEPNTYQFVFRERQHDFDTKTFRGKTGNFTGDDIINMILEDRQTAAFITRNLWKSFVHQERFNEPVIEELADQFYRSDYNISKLMIELFSHPEFYKEPYVGSHIKSPIELLAGIRVQTGGTFNRPENILFLQKAMDQVLFFPPNVGGWPQGKEWIDSSSLTFRMGLPTVLFKNTGTEFQGKDDGDVNNVTNQFKQAGKLSIRVDWNKLADRFTKTTEAETIKTLETFLLARPAVPTSLKLAAAAARGAGDEPARMQKLFTGFMSLPEYQLS